ncbi:MAG: ribosomal protection-like ABC-F family protein [Treponema sp.]
MPFVQLSKVSLAFGDRDILDDVTLILTQGTKAALAGANGSGKSTLMKVIAGEMPYDSGEISKEKGTTLAYLPQSGIVLHENTVYEEVEKAFLYGFNIIEEIEEILQEMKVEKDEDKLYSLSHKQYELQTKLDESPWSMREALIEEVLQGLGFLKTDFNRKTSEFSGGWQMRIALAKVLLSNSDILILDEPINYLDIEARTYLQDYLIRFKGGFLLVSHDRYFLDSVVKDTYEIMSGKLRKYHGTYTEYEKQRAEEVQYLVKKWKEQQEEIAKNEEFIRRFRSNASKAALVQDRIKRLEKLEIIELPEHLKTMHFSFPAPPHSGKIVINAKDITKSYGERCVIKDFRTIIERGSKICIVGRNGAGKSTLLRILAQQDINFLGEAKLGEGVVIGYFSQEASEEVKGKETVLEYIEEKTPLELIPRVKSMLGAFLFRGDDVYKSISVLSGGEKSRLALLSLLLKPLNLLILDEPTNHLDINSKDVLLEALKKFSGTVLFVSHDKYFIQNLATGIIELKHEGDDSNPSSFAPSRIRFFPGTYDYYLYQIEKEEKGGEASFFSIQNERVEKTSVDKSTISYEEQKKKRAENAKKRKEEATLIDKMELLEKNIKAKEELLGTPEVYKDGEATKKIKGEIAILEEELAIATKEWENLAF